MSSSTATAAASRRAILEKKKLQAATMKPTLATAATSKLKKDTIKKGSKDEHDAPSKLDAATAAILHAVPGIKKLSAADRKAAEELTSLCDRFLECCEAESNSTTDTTAATPASSSSPSSSPAATALAELRRSVLLHPMPVTHKSATTCSVRGLVWQLLLGASPVSSSSYLSLLSHGSIHPRELYQKIRGDVFRTFRDDGGFWEVVTEEQMSRLLNAFVWEQHTVQKYQTKDGAEKPSPFTYLQGMNAIAGCFLYCLPELDAFACLRTFITRSTPLYWLSSHIGANAGCKLVDAILEVVDPTLATHLAAYTPGAYVYAFHCVSGFCATIRPLEEVMRLWDFLLAFGPHFNVLCVAAQIVLLRRGLLSTSNPKSILDYRSWPRLDASKTIALALSFLPHLPHKLYTNIVRHATDMAVAEMISGTKMHDDHRELILQR